MGISTDGIICFGLDFGEGFGDDFELPWIDAPYDGDEKEWWLDVLGYKPPFHLYTESGEYIGGARPDEAKIDKYYKHRHDFQKEHPLPVEIVRHCSYEYMMYIVAIPGTVKVARRGYPNRINMNHLMLSVTKEKLDALYEFCREHVMKTGHYPEQNPEWYLCSMWG